MPARLQQLLKFLNKIYRPGMAQALFPNQANGSVMIEDGKAIGSALIDQSFTSPGYFHGRPSAAGQTG